MTHSSGARSAEQPRTTEAESTGDESPAEQPIPHSRTGDAPARQSDEATPGKTSIASSVVQKIAATATREMSGVYAMGGGVSRAFGALRERIPGGGGTTQTSGVQVEVGEKQAAVDLDLIVEYGVSIVDLSRAVRRNVITAVERMCGLDVIEVNISVNDIHLPDDDSTTEDAEPASNTRGSTSRVE